MFLQLLANGLVTGSVIAIAAVGVSLVYEILRIVNFAHGDYLTFGAFVGVAANVRYGERMLVATLVAIVGTALLALVLEFVLWRPMRRRGAGFMSLFITSIGLALLLRHLLFLVAGAEPRSYAVDPFKVYVIGSVRLGGSQGVAIVVGAVAIVLVGLLLARTALGRQMRALADDRALASIAGVNVDRVVVYTWLLAGALAGLAGVLQGLVQASFTPNTGFQLLLPIFAAAIVGGIGRPFGAIAGGFIIAFSEVILTYAYRQFAGYLLPAGVQPEGLLQLLGTDYKFAVSFIILVVVLLVRPTGIFRGRVI